MRQALIFTTLMFVVGLLTGCRSAATSAPSTPAAATATSSPMPSPPSGASAPGAALASPTPACNPARMESVSFVSTTQGWAAGDSGIFTTSDGGAHWRLQYAVSSATEVQFLDGRTGFVLSSLGFMTTIDGGATWSIPPTPEGQPSAFDMVSATAGWVIGPHDRTDTSSQLMRVSILEDNGQRYEMYSDPVVSPADAVCFGDAQHGWVADGRGVQRTTDGGATWSPTFAYPFADNPDRDWVPLLTCQGAGIAYVLYADGYAAGNRPYEVYRTTDAGATWREVLRHGMAPQAAGVTVGAGSYPGAIAIIDAAHAVYAAQCPPCNPAQSTIETTADAGATWRIAPQLTAPSPSADPDSIDFVDAQHGWLATEDGIYATTDGGDTWAHQYP